MERGGGGLDRHGGEGRGKMGPCAWGGGGGGLDSVDGRKRRIKPCGWGKGEERGLDSVDGGRGNAVHGEGGGEDWTPLYIDCLMPLPSGQLRCYRRLSVNRGS